MQEHEYYNIYHRAKRSAAIAEHDAKQHTTDMMIEHLYVDHKLKVRQIAKRLNVKEKVVRAYIINRFGTLV